jgi:hypothetical protein
MEVVEQRKLFDEEFNIYLNNDKSNYLNKLLEFTMEKEVDLQDPLVASVNSLQEAILESVISSETEDDYETDIDDVRKEKVDNILYSINNYLMSLAPSEALMKILNNPSTLIKESVKYTDDLFVEISNKVKYLKSISNIEYKNNKLYHEAIDAIERFLQYKEGFSLIYSVLNKDVINIDRTSPLTDVQDCVEELTREAKIINKFDPKVRSYVSTMLDKVNKLDDEDGTEILNRNNTVANILESILMNYTMLSLYSNKPESIRISDNMLKIIAMEVAKGNIDKNDIIETLEDGPIKFDEEELEFIKSRFINKIFYREDKTKIEKQDLIKLVK